MQITKDIFELIFPQGTYEWFDIVDGKREEGVIHITFVEKDIPPFDETSKDKKILARKFHNITVSDFPLRGKRVLLTFRRRYWKIEGQEEYLKRDIQITLPGTQLEQEFANFLKERGRD